MHEWHTNNSTNILELIKEFIGFKYETDWSDEVQTVSSVVITEKVCTNREEAANYVTTSSYGDGRAYLAAYTTNRLLKGYLNVFKDFVAKYNEYVTFKKNLNIGYGRKSSKVTCPNCESSISLNYGSRFKSCPICGSKKIISDSNWKILETKYKMAEKASEKLSNEAKKNNIMFICGFEWHC